MEQRMEGRVARLVTLLLVLCMTACGGDDGGADDTAPAPPPPPPPAGIGPAGGTVTGPDGAKVVIPAGALATNIAIAIEQTSAGAPALPAGFTASGQMYAFTPHGTTFAVPVTLTLPFDPASVPAGATPALYKTNAQNVFEHATGATFAADTVTADVTGFSFVQIVIPPLVRNDPVREWEFALFPADESPEVRLDGDTLVGGQLEEIGIFGPAVFDEVIIGTSESQQPDGVANGFVFSSPNGVTYGVFAEAPSARLGRPEPMGSATRLKQTQSFIKRAGDASLTFTLTSVFIEAIDFTPPLLTGVAPLKGEVLLAVQAYKAENEDPFFYTAGRASVFGANGHFFPHANDESFSRSHLWSMDDFDFFFDHVSYDSRIFPLAILDPEIGNCPGTMASLRLKHPKTYNVDLSSIGIDEEFTLRVDTHAEANNRRGGLAVGDCEASAVDAYLRDPQEIGGTTFTFTGLEPTNRPLPTPTQQVLVEPAACTSNPAPDPAAGVIQFDAAAYTIDEFARPVQSVVVTRSGGSAGAATVTVRTSDGSAVAGSDYQPVNATVFFGDGDDGQRIVAVPIVLDQLDEEDETLTLALSQPGGCVALGAQTSAVLTILDDDLPPPSGSVGLDASFGSAGKATAPAFGGDNSAMALQGDGKVVIVGGTFTDFILARFNADGSLDTTFDADGKVTTDMVSNEQEEALGVAIQGDGKIVVVGYTGTPGNGGPANFALARYNIDGSLDTSFGLAGKVVSGVPGIARAVAIQSDNRIVVVGDVPVAGQNNDFSDFAIARYDSNGSLDPGFGAGGRLSTDIGDGTNTARNVVVQANAAIVVSGEPIGTFIGSDHTDVVRYDSGGNLDPTFGNGGTATLNGARVGEGLAVQSDGKLVLVGEIEVATPPATQKQFAVRRLNANGSPDIDFGTAGAVSTSISDRGDSAHAVALQSDGKILVAGRSSAQTNSEFALARYNTDGSLDTGFAGNGGGRLTVDFFGFTDIAESVAVMSDGRIVLGGLARDNVDGYGVARILQ